MFRCPHSGVRLVKARAGGGTFWYSPDSDGRMLSLAFAREFFGPDKVREIWVRSERFSAQSENACPACLKPMRKTELPDWVGRSPIDVCRRCRILWIDGESYDEIPKGSQLIHARGDSTLVKDLGEAYLDHNKAKLKAEREAATGETSRPESTVETVLTFMKLPIERSNRAVPQWPIISALVLVTMFALQVFFTDADAIVSFGYYPGEPLRNLGLNMLLSVLLHGGWVHLIFNSYFAYILSDDVEDDLGHGKFIGFIVFVTVAVGLMQAVISGSPESPHIGFSGVVMALFAYYGLQFPKAKLPVLASAYPKVLETGVYKGFGPTDESVVAMGEVQIDVVTDRIATIRYATGLEVQESHIDLSQLVALSPDGMSLRVQLRVPTYSKSKWECLEKQLI